MLRILFVTCNIRYSYMSIWEIRRARSASIPYFTNINRAKFGCIFLDGCWEENVTIVLFLQLSDGVWEYHDANESPHKTHCISDSESTLPGNTQHLIILRPSTNWLNMGISKLTTFALLALRTVSVFAAIQDSVSSFYQAPTSFG